MPVLVMLGALLGLAGAAPQGGETVASHEEHDGQARQRARREVRRIGALAHREGASGRRRNSPRKEDGDEAAFAEVVRAQVVVDSTVRNTLFTRMEFALESLDGRMNEIARDFRRQSDLDIGEIYPFDEVLAGYDPSAHVVDDFFANRLAFAVLLNFPLTTLEQRLTPGRDLVAPPVGGGAVRRALRQARARPTSTSRSSEANADARPATSPRTTSGSTTSSTRRDSVSFRRRCGCCRTGTCATRSRPTIPSRSGLARQREIALVCDRIVTQTIPGPSSTNPIWTGTPSRNGQGLDRARTRTGGDLDGHEDLQRPRARHALRDAAREGSRPRARPTRTRRWPRR